MIALQFCVSFCCTTTWISYKYTYPIPLEPPTHPPHIPPLQVITEPEESSLWNKAVSHQLSILCIVVHISEKAMAPHSSTLAWKLPWTEEPGRLQSMGSWRVGHDWTTSISLFTFMRWRKKWQPTPVFLPGESHGRRSLVGCSPWGCKESDTTEVT